MKQSLFTKQEIVRLIEITWLSWIGWIKEIIMFNETDPGYAPIPVYSRWPIHPPISPGDGGTTI